MSKSQKPILILGALLLAGGMLISLGAFAAAGFDIKSLSTTSRDWVENTDTFKMTSNSTYTEISVKDVSENVRIEATRSDSIEVVYWENKQKHFEVQDSDGVLLVEAQHDPVVNFMALDFEDRTTVIRVPIDYAGSLVVELANGNISVSGFAKLEQVRLSTATGDIEVKELTANRASVNTMGGTVYFTDVIASEMVANVVTGNVEAFFCQVDTVNFEIASGNITAYFMGSADEYLIAASSVSGNINVPHGATGVKKSISVHVTTGNIDLAFSEDSPEQAR